MTSPDVCDNCMRFGPTRKTNVDMFGIKDTLYLCTVCGHWDPDDEEE